MKTKCTFEPDDFHGAGQMVIRNSSTPGSKYLDFASTVAYKIGFVGIAAGQKHAMISLADGLVSVFDSLEKICDRLNEDRFGYRPMTPDEIAKILRHVGNRFKS